MKNSPPLPEYLYDGGFTLGANLTLPNQNVYEAIGQLNVDLLAIGCEACVLPANVTHTSEPVVMNPNTPLFNRVVGEATQSIVWREDIPRDPQAPVQVDVQSMITNATEGATWINPIEMDYRKRIVWQNSGILRAVLDGMSSNGYKRRAGESVMRQEFEMMLDTQWSRGSYRSFRYSKVMTKIMKESGLRRPSSTVKSMVRFGRFSKQYGIGLATLRLMPDEVLNAMK